MKDPGLSAVRIGACILAALFSAGNASAETCPETSLAELLLPGMAKGVCQSYAVQRPDDSTACFWAFDYRSPNATTFADAIWLRVTACEDGKKQANDQIVNHPDSYAPRTWVTDEAAKTVSIKDKAALNKTLVFLRIEPKG